MYGNFQTLTKWAVHIPYKATNWNDMEQTVCIVPALFCAKRYVNDARYRVGHRTALDGRRSRPRESNVVFEQIFCSNSQLQCADQNSMTSKAFQNVCCGEMFCADYGESYSSLVQSMTKRSEFLAFYNQTPHFNKLSGKGIVFSTLNSVKHISEMAALALWSHLIIGNIFWTSFNDAK